MTIESLGNLLTKGLEIHRVTVAKNGFVVITEYCPPEFTRREYRDGTSLLRRNRDIRFAQSSFEHVIATLKTLTPLDVKRAAQYISSKPHAEVILGQ